MIYPSYALRALLALALACCVSAPGLAQPTYSIDVQGPTFLAPDGFGSGMAIQGADILTNIGPGTPPPAPGIVIPHPALGIPPTMFVEMDALSYGQEPPLPTGAMFFWFFSVDEFAIGDPTVPAPSVATVGPAGGFAVASADVFRSVAAPPIVLPPPPIAPGVHTGLWDGDNLPIAYGTPGLNLVEPNPPAPMTFPDPGDNVDACDVNDAPGLPVFFSLDSAFPDPLEGPPINTGTAVANGTVGGDVLMSAGGGFVIYAAAALLGLDTAGPDTDDLDALVVWDNGDGIYQPVTRPYSWASAATTDMILYSVRRGSAVLGTLDALHGLPIEEGDVLVPVTVGPGVWAPGIFVPAEHLGLATTRSGTAGPFGPDDLDGLDMNGC
ncbi:MAG: hypothetical protein AAGN66_24445 [Acidobacteriota bacterium]